jgi:hypothetical protein
VILGVLVIVGVLLAWQLGANLGRLWLVRLRASWIVFVALGIQLLLFTPVSSALRLPVSESKAHVLTYAALLIFVAANIRQPGFGIAAAGCAVNTIVIAANDGRMPVSLASWTATGKPASELTQHGAYNNVVLASGAHLSWLGDVFALPRAVPLANSLSIGDLLLLIGVLTFVFRASLPAREKHTAGRTRETLSVGPFRRLIAGRTVSKLGDWLTMTAVVTWLYVETRSSFLVSIFLILRMGATVVGGVVATPLLDRFTRFRTLWFVEVFRGVLTLATIPLAALGQHYWVIAAVALSAAFSAATDPSASSVIPELLPERLVHAGNAVHGVARNIMMVAGTLAGGLIVAKVGITKALLVDVATFVLAAFLYRRFISEAPSPHAENRGSRSEVFGALLQRVTLGLTVSFTIVTIAMAILNASLPAFFDVRLGDAHAYGYGMAAIGAGLLCGEALSSCVRRDAVARRSVALAFLLCGGAIFVISNTTVQATAYLFLFLLGAADGTTEVVYDTLFQARVPSNVLSGAFAAAAAIQRTGMILGFLLAPLLLGFGTTPTLEFSGAICVFGALVAGVTLIRGTGKVAGDYLETDAALAAPSA